MSGYVTNWQVATIDGKDFLVIDVASFRIPLDWDPSSNMMIAVAAPDGALGNFPALVKGEDGDTPNIDLAINLTALAWDDPTPESADFTKIDDTTYQLNLIMRNGEPGADGAVVLAADDTFGTPLAGRLLRVKSDLSGFEYTPMLVGDRIPAPSTFAHVPTGNAAYTIVALAFDAQAFDWRPEIEGQTAITYTGADCTTDLVARLSTTGTINGETAGPIVAMGLGLPGPDPCIPVFSSAVPAASSDTYDKVLAGNTATVYIRTERRGGSQTYSTSADTTIVGGRVMPVP